MEHKEARIMKVKYILFIVGLFFCVSSVYAHEPEKQNWESEKWKSKKEAMIKEIYKQLNLTPEQKKKLEANRNKLDQQKKKLFEDFHAKRKEIREELQRPELNMEKVKQINSEFKDLMAKKADHRLERILNVRKILTPEQFSKFMEIKSKHRWRKHHGSKGMKKH